MGPAIPSEGYVEPRIDSRAVPPKDVLELLGTRGHIRGGLGNGT